VECEPQLARKVSPGGGVPLVGPQEEHAARVDIYTPKGVTSLPGREAKYGFSTKNKQANKDSKNESE